ncbi:MAG: heavy-metal-associated domain-containing protein [Actinobacteria bacterium]|nr:heavy-metal-associated domain-containing protein [Actinomycetota bacterium]
MDELRFTVPGMTCGHCVQAVHDGIAALPGVADIAVDLESKVVVVRGTDLDPAAVDEAVDDAGFEVAR